MAEELISTSKLAARNRANQILEAQEKQELSEEEKKAVRAGAARAWYADLPGAATDITGMALDYGAEGLSRLLPSELAGYDLPKSLGIKRFQKAMRDPALGHKHLEKLGVDAGYIPPTTGTEEEERARLLAGFIDPVPLPVGSMKFTSPAVKAVKEIKQEKMPANQWISQMRGRGVNKDELYWTGVEDWLKSKKGSVTKQELDEYLEANQIQVQEVVYGAGKTKFGHSRDLVLPGGENYRELVLTYKPTAKPDEMRFIVSDGENIIVGNDRLPYKEALKRYAPELSVATNVLDNLDIQSRKTSINDVIVPEMRKKLGALKDSDSPFFTGGHFPEPNTIAWIRFNERTDADGKRVLFIEEIQSDWGHKGLEEGFGPAGGMTVSTEHPPIRPESEYAGPEVRRLLEQSNRPEDFKLTLTNDYDAYNEVLSHPRLKSLEDEELGWELVMDELYMDLFGKNTVELEEIWKFEERNIPAGPFVMDTHQWSALTLKRMVRWAADNDFDSIAWTSGKQQADRYNLSKHISEIHYSGSNLKAYDHSGNTVIEQTGIREEDLPAMIGKEATDKLLKQPKDGTLRSLLGQDLELGGDYVKFIYDSVLPAQAKKLGKKYGAKVEEVYYGSAKDIDARSLFEQDWINATERPYDLHIDINDNKKEFLREVRTERVYEQANKLGLEPGSDDFLDYLDDAQDGLHDELFTDSELNAFKDEYWSDQNVREDYLELSEAETGDEKVWSMNLTDKLKQAAKDGLPYYVALPPVAAGVASQAEAEAADVKRPAVEVKTDRILEEALP